MLRPLAEFIDSYRIWHKVTFERGRILKTPDRRWEGFDRREHYETPEIFFGRDGKVPDVETRHERTTPRAEVLRFSFDSPRPITGYSYPETNRVSGLLYRRTGDRDRPVVVLAHGWAHDEVRPLEVIYVEPLLKEGYSVAVPSLPFHFDRTPEGLYSGELMVTGDVILTVEAFRQGAADLCGLINWLFDAGHRQVGLLGYSLGGYMAGLVACLRDDLEFVVIAGAGDSVVSPILDTGLGVNVRDDLSKTGMDRRASLERAWGVISPGRLRLRMPRERVLLVTGRYDRIMIRESVENLWEKWRRPAVLWEAQGHYSLLAVPGRVVRRAVPFIRRMESRPPAG